MKHDLETLKERVRIPEVWQRLGLPGTPGKSCRSPFRAEKSPSFSVYDEGRKWKDFSTNEGGDVIDFVAHACNVHAQEATRRFLAIAGEPVSIAPMKAESSRAGALALPVLHRGDDREIMALAQARCLRPDAITLGRSLNTLTFADVCGFPCWLLTDTARMIAEARRLDGKVFPAVGPLGERKAHTIKGSAKAWPAGVAVLATLPSFRAVMIVEGGPDYLAALHFACAAEKWDVLPVAMLGRSAGMRINVDALALLRGRRVRIYPHADADAGGVTSARVWAEQLHAHGCDVDLYDFTGLMRRDGRAVKDLNDAAVIAPAQEHELSDLLP